MQRALRNHLEMLLVHHLLLVIHDPATQAHVLGVVCPDVGAAYNALQSNVSVEAAQLLALLKNLLRQLTRRADD